MEISRKRAFDIACGGALIVVALLLAGTQLSFGVKLAVAVAMILSSGLVARQLQFSWSETMKLLGWLMLLAVVLNSGIGRAFFTLINAVDTRVGAAVDDGSVSALVDGSGTMSEPCQAEDSPPWVMKLGELRTLTAGCEAYRINDRLLPSDANGEPVANFDSPDINGPVEEIIVMKRIGPQEVVIRVSETEMRRRGLDTMRFGFCMRTSNPLDKCAFPNQKARE